MQTNSPTDASREAPEDAVMAGKDALLFFTIPTIPKTSPRTAEHPTAYDNSIGTCTMVVTAIASTKICLSYSLPTTVLTRFYLSTRSALMPSDRALVLRTRYANTGPIPQSSTDGRPSVKGVRIHPLPIYRPP